MKLVYVCSPLRGDIENNIKQAHEYNNYVIDCGFMPLAPHVIFSKYFDDNIPERREKGLAMGLELLRRCDEIWVCGETVSQGMRGEINLAQQLKIPVFFINETYRLCDLPVRQRDRPLSSFECTGESLDTNLEDKILVLDKAESIDDSLWKLSPAAKGYDDLLNVVNIVTGAEADIWRNGFAGIVRS